MEKKEIFLLTKPPHSDRTKLCLHLMELAENGVLYIAGDGVYNLLEEATIGALPRERILACKEDLEARGVQAGEKATVLGELLRAPGGGYDFRGQSNLYILSGNLI